MTDQSVNRGGLDEKRKDNANSARVVLKKRF